MKIPAHYMAYADLGQPYNIAPVTDNEHFDGAVLEYSEWRGKGHAALVARVEPHSGKWIDVTADADARVVRWCELRGDPLPEWLSDKPDPCARCAREVCNCDTAYDEWKESA